MTTGHRADQVRRIRFRGITFTVGPPHAVAQVLLGAASHPSENLSVRLVNFNTLSNAHANPEYDKLLRNGGINLVDSTPLAWIMSLTSRQKVQATRGPDVMRETISRGLPLGIKHYLLGGTPETLQSLVSTLETNFQKIHICGSSSPPFHELTAAEVDWEDRLIEKAKPNVVWVGLGGMKQDGEAARIAEAHKTTSVGVGAAFDFLTGTQPEAPQWLRHSGFEWAFRLLTEPVRLLPRYTKGTIGAIRWILKRDAA